MTQRSWYFSTLAVFATVTLGFGCRGSEPRREIVFVCEHGAAKSVLAVAYFNKLARQRGLAVHAIARGAEPQPTLSVATVQGLARDGLTPEISVPLPLTAADSGSAREVIAFDCDRPAVASVHGAKECWNDVPAVGDDYDAARDRIVLHLTSVLDRAGR